MNNTDKASGTVAGKADPAVLRSAEIQNSWAHSPIPGQRAEEPAADQQQARYVQELIAGQASRRPESAAVASAEAQLTYCQLDQSANRLAHYLRGAGVGPETLVGVHLERGIDVIRCLLAILKAGGAYLPLDPSLPAARVSQMCAEAGPMAILSADGDITAFPPGKARVLRVGELAPELAGQPATAPPDISLQPGNVAYAIYTSGSTGQPKAVTVGHGSLACLIRDISRAYRISPRDRVLQLASLGFDTSLEQILVTLAGGATLLLPPAGTVAPTDLLRYLADEQVTVMDLTPAYWHQLLALTEPADERLRTVRLMITGGDMADRADCAAALRAAPGARLLNAYGLTETTITSTLYEVGGQQLPSGTVPVGKPLPHVQVLVLDDHLNPVPASVTGEIYIGGRGVALGYLGRPELTAELFLPNPHSAEPGARMYRTRDVGRWREDGNLEVLGRADRQLKIRGFRVEPGEIESALASHPAISEAAVAAWDCGPGNRQLVAYYTLHRIGRDGPPGPQGAQGAQNPQKPDPRAGGLPPDESLRAFLMPRVPGYMIPDMFIALVRIPRTPDGTVDRDALPEPVISTGVPAGSAGRVSTRLTPLQAGMSHLWSSMLHAGPIGLDDDFFRLGGNSLLAAEMLANVRVMFGVSPAYVRPLTRCLLRDPTLRGFCGAIAEARAGRLTADGAEPRIDFARESALDHLVRLDEGPSPDWRRPREILLTGSTGFFGVYLLRELLAATDARVHCLVRAPDASHALRRIVQAAERHQLGGLDPKTLDRVVPVAGDLAAPRLGLPPAVFRELARSIDVIHHDGAIVNFIYPYEDLRAANVTGTRELIRMAGLFRGIPIHYVSTTAVLAGFGAMGVPEVSEDTPLAYPEHLRVGYVETKYVAEELLRNAGRAGLPVAIYRPLDIVGGYRGGTWNTAAEMCALMRFITDTGLAPDIDVPLDFVPADICAAAIRHISSHAAPSGTTYHLASPEHALLNSLVERLRVHGYAIRAIPYDEWIDELLRYAARHPAHPMTPFVPLFVDRSGDSGLTIAEMYLKHVFPSYTRSHTEQALRGSGIAFPPVDAKLLDLNIDRLMTMGYLKETAGCRLPTTGTGPRSRSRRTRGRARSRSART
jgi:amino acid adenylation domain-containing protein/thioester reductase-like protein